jgi:hypothetical protein
MDSTVSFYDSHDDISAALAPPFALIKHGEGLTDAWGHAQVDAQVASRSHT